jgi:hypothetical protein
VCNSDLISLCTNKNVEQFLDKLTIYNNIINDIAFYTTTITYLLFLVFVHNIFITKHVGSQIYSLHTYKESRFMFTKKIKKVVLDKIRVKHWKYKL